MLASLRYLETLVKMARAWLFAGRQLDIDWLEERALSQQLLTKRKALKPAAEHRSRK
jgi:hypothetical protein